MDARSAVAIAVTLTFWASAFAGIRAGLEAYGPGSLALLRFLTASVVLAGVAVYTRMKLPRLHDIPFIAFSSLLGISFYHVSLNYGEITVTAGSASFIIGTVPIFSAVLAAFILKESVSLRTVIGIGVSFLGVCLITVGESEGSLWAFDYGALFILASAFATSVFFVLQKPYLLKYGALEFTTYAIWAGTLFMLVFLPDLIREIGAAPPAATASVVYLGIFPSAISYVCWAYALSRVPVSRVTSFLYVSPVVACGVAWVWLGEVPPMLSFIGGAIALTGVALVSTASGMPGKPPTNERSQSRSSQ